MDMQFFGYQHLKDETMRNVSKQFHDLAVRMSDMLPFNDEKEVMLRKLLEAKDCAVRALLSNKSF